MCVCSKPIMNTILVHGVERKKKLSKRAENILKPA